MRSENGGIKWADREQVAEEVIIHREDTVPDVSAEDTGQAAREADRLEAVVPEAEGALSEVAGAADSEDTTDRVRVPSLLIITAAAPEGTAEITVSAAVHL